MRTTISIGRKEYEAIYSESPIDGYHYSVDATGSESLKFPQKFNISYLRGVTGATFPNDLDVNIWQANRSFKEIEVISLRKKDNNCTIDVLVCLDFDKWSLHESLGYFSDRFKFEIEKGNYIRNVSIRRSEYGYSIECTSNVSFEEDLFLKLIDIEGILECSYRAAIFDNKNKEENIKYGEKKYHWWIRYVIVPVVGSGTIAAVLANVFSKLI